MNKTESKLDIAKLTKQFDKFFENLSDEQLEILIKRIKDFKTEQDDMDEPIVINTIRLHRS